MFGRRRKGAYGVASEGAGAPRPSPAPRPPGPRFRSRRLGSARMPAAARPGSRELPKARRRPRACQVSGPPRDRPRRLGA